MPSGVNGGSGGGGHIGHVVIKHILLPDFDIFNRVSEGSAFSFGSEIFRNVESSDSSFNLIISGSSFHEHNPLIRVETLSHDIFEKSTSSNFSFLKK